MVVDTSAFVAIALAEPEASGFLEALESAATRLISAASVLEASLVLVGRSGPEMLADVDALIDKLDLTVEPFSTAQVAIAQSAFVRYGKGRHAAGLNFGDCFTYALAKTTGLPILFKGDDFSRTDLQARQ